MSATDDPPVDHRADGNGDRGRVEDVRDYGTLPTVVPDSATFVFDGY